MLRNILTREVPTLAADYAQRVLATVLGRARLTSDDIAAWIMHAGGRDVLLAVERRFELDHDALRYSAAMLREYGNLSSAFVYFVLEAALADDAPAGWWWLSSFGAGFSCHGALLRVDVNRDGFGVAHAAARPRTRNARPSRARRPGGAALAPRPAPRQRASWARAGSSRARSSASATETQGAAAAHRRARLRRRPADARGRAPSRRALAERRRSTCSIASRSSMRRRSPPTPPPAGARARSSPTFSTGPTTTTASAGTSSSPISFSITSKAPRCGRLLAGCARRADALAACEPRRSRFALGASHLIFFLGANAVTRNDGVLSVRAGFVGSELGAAWPGDGRRVADRRVRRRPVHALLLRRAAAAAP